MKHWRFIATFLLMSVPVIPQTGGPYEIKQSVISNGGSTSDGGTYSITGTAGQNIAGTHSSAGAFSVRGGFWQSFLAPTAATVSIAGRVTDVDGRPLGGVRLTLEGTPDGYRSALTNGFGYFTFEEIEVGRLYLILAEHRTYQFVPRTINVVDNVIDLDIVALP